MRTHPTMMLLFISTFAIGCATKGFVHREAVAVEERLGQKLLDTESQVEQNQTDLAALDDRTSATEEHVAELSKTTQEALDRAIAAGKLAEGKFLYETVLTDDQVRFEFDKAELSGEAHTALADFATGIKGHDEDVFIEIQGHTDSTGPEPYNHKLGLARAEAVRSYLSKEQGFALHRISVISYGEEEPVATNDSRENRSKNRRVKLVVLK